VILEKITSAMKSILKRKFSFGRTKPAIAIFELPESSSEDSDDEEVATAMARGAAPPGGYEDLVKELKVRLLDCRAHVLGRGNSQENRPGRVGFLIVFSLYCIDII
jgi:hypothetical protein